MNGSLNKKPNRTKTNIIQKGFTLLELMIVVAIIGILSTLALPVYKTYVEKARFTEVFLAVGAAKSAVELCFQSRGRFDLDNCDSFTKIGVIAADLTIGGEIASVTIATNAIITGTGTDTQNSTYILTPVIESNSLTWTQTGTCIASGVC